MTDDAIGNLPAALDVAVFERLADARFRSLGRLPGWVPSDIAQSEPVDLADRLPMLEIFFPQFEAVWQADTGHRVESDVWTEDTESGPQYLQAVAFRLGDRRLIALRSLPQTLYSYQQIAHDLEIQKDRVEKMRRELAELNAELEIKRQEAERATRAKSDFLASMSHEIRTPLNSVIGMADVLSATPLLPDQRKCVDVLQRNGIRLLNLINDILDLSKVESGKVELERHPMALTEVIGAAIEVAEVRAKAKGLAIARKIAPGVPEYLVGDSNRLRQIIINLLGNGLKFTERGGLEVRVEPDPHDATPGALRFAVSDTGIGIPRDKVDLIFESFTQADSSTTRKYGGTGLGLSISRQLVELMGGRIWVESEVGRGSTFYFTVKLSVASAAPAPQAKTAEALELRPGLRILLADDSEDNRFLIHSYLKGAQASIDDAENGEIALGMFRAARYDVVLLDIEMPVMDGYGAARLIREYEREQGLAPTPVLALTAHAFADIATKTAAAGFTSHLTKPIRQAALLAALARHTAGATAAGPAQMIAEPAPRRIKVLVEEGLEDVAPGYLQKRQAEVETYRKALAGGDFDAIRMMGHKMKGTGAGYGFPVLTALGAAIETAALHRDAATIQAKVDELEQYTASVELEYRAAQSGGN